MKKVLYLLFIFTILLMSWDFNKEDQALASANNVIPEEAIRLRIIANSDSPEDQLLKQQVRDLVTEEINKWVGSLDNIEDARKVIELHIPDIQKIVDDTIANNGYHYSEKAKVELGVVPFPTKMYGDIVYPAGDYEALRITLGEGQGDNWWCVLFPPLCFVDMSTGDAVRTTDTTNIEKSSDDGQANSEQEVTEDIEVKFFLVEIFSKLGSFVKGLV